jgi:FtsP/CotA-like multicopper oxidase with cupredoxin domain
MTRQKNRNAKFLLTPAAAAVLLLSAQYTYAGPGLGQTTYSDNRPTPTYYAHSPSGMRAEPTALINSNGASVNLTIDTGTPLRKFVDPLPRLCTPGKYPAVGKNVTGTLVNKCIPVAVPDKVSYPNSDYYEIGVVEYQEYLHADLPKATQLRGYVQLNDPANPVTKDAAGKIIAWPTPHYLGPIISTERGRAVRVKFVNLLPAGQSASIKDPITGKVKFIGPRNGDLFLPVDQTLMGAGLGPDGATMYLQNRAELHLHGGDTPWISDGTPHQWITPAADEIAAVTAGMKEFARGASTQNVPDMPDPGPGAVTYYWPNNQSARLMFYHDHTAGITRLNVYAGEVAGYMISDPTEKDLVARGVLPPAADTIPLFIQEKTFVSKDIALQDAKWNENAWGTYGDLWFPHVYETNQDPNSSDGTNPTGRWDWGPYFWPVFPSLYSLPSGEYGDVTTTPESFLDTPVINGTAYPYLTVEPKAYRFRILNATNDRFLNLGLYQADPNQCDGPRCNVEINMVKFNSGVAAFPSAGGLNNTGWGQPDSRAGGVPNPLRLGPNIIQIGTDGGFLPQAVDIPSTPVNFEYNRRSITVLNVLERGLMMGAAERADVIIDFSKYAGRTLILYNDAPAPLPGFDPRIDYHQDSNDPRPYDNYLSGGAMPTKVGYGPNTRTIMQIRVANTVTSAPTYKRTPTGEFDKGSLQVELPKAYAASQEKPIIPQTAYNLAWPGLAASDQYALIKTGSLQQPTFDFVPADPGVMGGVELQKDPATGAARTGSGYMKVPSVKISHATGTGAEATAVMKIGHISVTNAGAGYVTAPLVTISTLTPPGATTAAAGGGANAVAFLKVVSAVKNRGGSGYQAGPVSVTLSAPDGWAKYGTDRVDLGLVRAQASAVVDAITGEITKLTITNPGAGYTAIPKVFIKGTGTGADFTLDGGVERIDLPSPLPGRPDLAGGRGYTDMSAVSVTLSGGGVGGTPRIPATAVPTGAVAEVAISSGGNGYTSTPSPATISIDPPSAGWPSGFVLPADVTASTASASPTNSAKMVVISKAIQELFEPNYGRMNATLGIELPYTSALTQTTIPLSYIDPASEKLKDGETQLWKITHNGVDTHPVHFHLVNLQLINRIGWDGTVKPPRPNELGWKETIQMNPLEDIVVAVRAKKPVTPGFGLPQSVRLMDPTQPRYAMTGFTQIDTTTGNPGVIYNDIENYNWEYVWHCHILGHEENDFMRPIVFDPKEGVPLPPTILTTATAPVSGLNELRWVDNAKTEYKYEITRSVNGAPHQIIGTALANASSFSLPAGMTTIPTGQVWEFKVRAVGATGTGETAVSFTGL